MQSYLRILITSLLVSIFMRWVEVGFNFELGFEVISIEGCLNVINEKLLVFDLFLLLVDHVLYSADSFKRHVHEIV